MLSYFAACKKRDDYLRLYGKLKKAISKHDEKVSEATDSYSRYINTVPNLSNTKIPSNDFDPKREEKNENLLEYFQNDKDKRSDLVSAADKAYERYEYYKALAAQILAEELRKAREKLEGLFGG